jgi:hypothetical protein
MWVALLVIALAAAWWWWRGRAGMDAGLPDPHAAYLEETKTVFAPHILTGLGGCDGRYQWDDAQKLFVRDDGLRTVDFNTYPFKLACRVTQQRYPNGKGVITRSAKYDDTMWRPA